MCFPRREKGEYVVPRSQSWNHQVFRRFSPATNFVNQPPFPEKKLSLTKESGRRELGSRGETPETKATAEPLNKFRTLLGYFAHLREGTPIIKQNIMS